jgi:hypothetical protein
MRPGLPKVDPAVSIANPTATLAQRVALHMKSSGTILFALFFTFSAHAQDGYLEIKPQLQDAIRRKIEGFGLNCPIPRSFSAAKKCSQTAR